VTPNCKRKNEKPQTAVIFMWWQLPASELKGIGPKKAHELRKLNIETIGDILGNYPRLNSYIDYSEVKKISELTTGGERQLFAGEIVSVVEKFSQKGKRYSLIVVTDGSAFAEIYFLARQRFLTRNFAAGSKVLVTGRVKPGRTARNVTEAVLQPIGDGENIKEPGILPVYSLAGSLTQTDLASGHAGPCIAAGETSESLPAGLVAPVVAGSLRL
jgi:ATP-dependent DNA helicase RecG